MPFGLARVVQEGGSRTDVAVAADELVVKAESCLTACVGFNFDVECAARMIFTYPHFSLDVSTYRDTILC